MNKTKDWDEFNKYIQNNNEELMKQIEEIEKKQGLPAGYIAELLYQRAKEGYNVDTALADIISKSYVTFDEMVIAFSNMTINQPSPDQISYSYEELKKAVDKLINPTDKAKKAMEKMGIKQL